MLDYLFHACLIGIAYIQILAAVGHVRSILGKKREQSFSPLQLGFLGSFEFAVPIAIVFSPGLGWIDISLAALLSFSMLSIAMKGLWTRKTCNCFGSLDVNASTQNALRISFFLLVLIAVVLRAVAETLTVPSGAPSQQILATSFILGVAVILVLSSNTPDNANFHDSGARKLVATSRERIALLEPIVFASESKCALLVVVTEDCSPCRRLRNDYEALCRIAKEGAMSGIVLRVDATKGRHETGEQPLMTHQSEREKHGARGYPFAVKVDFETESTVGGPWYGVPEIRNRILEQIGQSDDAEAPIGVTGGD